VNMSDLARFLDYARAFEVAFVSDDFRHIEPFFAESACHRVPGCAPLSRDDRGREAVVAGLAESVREIDRRFDTRIAEVVAGPEPRRDGIWMRFRLTLRRTGIPDLCFEGDHLTVFDDAGQIARIDEEILQAGDEAAREFMAEHASRLRPVGSPFSPPRPEDEAPLRDALQRTLVRAYAQAKSHQDVEAALTVCHPDFSVDTIPFRIASRDREDTRGQLGLFFSVFPDYRAETEGMASSEDGVGWWGDVAMTFGGALLGRPPTGKLARVSATSVFEFRDGLLAGERFAFDLGRLCEGIGVPLEELTAVLRPLQNR